MPLKNNLPLEFVVVNRLNIKQILNLLSSEELEFCYSSLSFSNFILLAAKCANRYVGYVALCPDCEEFCVSIKYIRVCQEFQRLNIARALLKEAAKICLDSTDYTTLLLSYPTGNSELDAFYNSLPGEVRLKHIEAWFYSKDHMDMLLSHWSFQNPQMAKWQVSPLKKFSDSLTPEQKEQYYQRERELKKDFLFEQNDIFFPPICEDEEKAPYCHIVLDGEKPAAWLLGKRENTDELYLSQLYIEKEYRTEPLFFVLVKHGLLQAASENLHAHWRIVHWSSSFLDISLKYFKKWGFSKIEKSYLKTCDLKNLLV